MSLLDFGIGLVLAVCSPMAYIEGAVASEGARQPFAAQVDIARAARNVLCDYGAENYLAGLGVANRARARGDTGNHHFRAYYDPAGFDPGLRRQWERAALIALTESPPVHVAHFVQRDAPLPAWWDRACAQTWESGDHIFCR